MLLLHHECSAPQPRSRIEKQQVEMLLIGPDQSCVPALVGDACGPAEQARPTQNGGLLHLRPGCPLLSLTSSFLAPSPFPQLCLVSPQLLSTHFLTLSGQTPRSRAECLLLVFVNSLELVRQLDFPSLSSLGKICSKQHQLLFLSCTLSHSWSAGTASANSSQR